MRGSELFLKMSLWTLLFLGLAEACIPQEVATEEKSKNYGNPKFSFVMSSHSGLMSRLSPDGKCQHYSPLDRTEEESKYFTTLSSAVKPALATSPPKKLLPKRKNGWNFLKCAYMVMTFLFVSYNKGDWCYCRYCNPDLDI
uniref:Epididymal protein 13 n=1 Tax=Propithecus coquereli TaxID=379532 RepID=A0A2K6FF49_PROCO